MSADSVSEEDEMMKGEALIRANFGVEPGGLSESEWSRLVCQAVWIETWRLRNMAEMIGRMFGDGRR